MPADTTEERRRLRQRGQALLDEAVADLEALPGSSRRRMFGCEGLFASGRVAAFVDGEGALVVKVPAGDAADLVAAGAATRVRMGRSPAREWVAVPWGEEALPLWQRLVHVSHAYVTAGA